MRCAAVMPVAPQLEITGLNPSYPVNAPIPFTIMKRAPGKVAFACAAEIQIDGRWQEVTWDIFSKAVKALSQFRSHSIATDTLEMKWDVPALTPSLRPEAGRTYRLRIDVLSPKTESFSSSAFSIEK